MHKQQPHSCYLLLCSKGVDYAAISSCTNLFKKIIVLNFRAQNFRNTFLMEREHLYFRAYQQYLAIMFQGE